MNIELDCIPCILRQTLDTVRLSTNDKDLHNDIIKRVLLFLENTSLKNITPPELGVKIYNLIKSFTGNRDPYNEIKYNNNKSLLNIYNSLKHMVERHPNPLEMGARLAIAGNIIDYGANSHPISIQKVIEDAESIEFSINHLDHLIEDFNKADKILYLADNAGEIVLDKLFIEAIKQFCNNGELDFTVVVRGKPVINDAIMEDAEFIGMNKVARVIDNGKEILGTILDYAPDEMKRDFDQADFIISKGQGNYETLDSEKKLIYFLLKIKCQVIANNIGKPIGAKVLMRNKID